MIKKVRKNKKNLEDYNINNCKEVEDLLVCVDWLIMCDDNSEMGRCFICTNSEENVKKDITGTFDLTQEFRKIKFAIHEHAEGLPLEKVGAIRNCY